MNTPAVPLSQSPRIASARSTSDKIATTGTWQLCFLVVALLLFSEALIPLAQVGGGTESLKESQLQEIIFGSIYLVTLSWFGFKRLITWSFRLKLFLMLFVVVLLSGLWSFFPSISFRREAAFFGTTMFGMYLGLRYNFREQMKLVALSALLAALLSIAAIILMPSVGIEASGSYAGTWRGIYMDKNICGRMMAVGSTAFLLLVGLSGWKKSWLWFGFGACFTLLLLTRSVTANGSFFALACIVPLYRMAQWPASRWRSSLWVPLLLLSILPICGLLSWVVANRAELLATIGRNPTLTGRLRLWYDVIEMVQRHPWLGYGFSGFFLQNGPVRVVWLDIGWQPLRAHDGYLDVLLELGLIGFTVFLLIVISSVWRGFRWLRLNRTVEGLWPICLLTLVLGYNLSESALLRQNSFMWVVFVATSYGLYKQLRLLRGARKRRQAVL